MKHYGTRSIPLGSLEQNKTKGSSDFYFPTCFRHWGSWMAISLRDHGENSTQRQNTVPLQRVGHPGRLTGLAHQR